MLYRYRWNIRYLYYFAKYKARGNEKRKHGYEPIASNEDELADVNVSYADEDSRFVVQKIYTELEENRGLKLYIRDRNAAVGKYICDNIFDAIEKTTETLIIMSEAYLKHKWCTFEMNMVGIKALKSDSDLVCVLMLDVLHGKLPLKVLRIIKIKNFWDIPGTGACKTAFGIDLKIYALKMLIVSVSSMRIYLIFVGQLTECFSVHMILNKKVYIQSDKSTSPLARFAQVISYTSCLCLTRND